MQSRFYHRNAHAAHPTRTLLAISAMPPKWELAVESNDLPTRSSAFGRAPNCKDSLTSPRQLGGKNAQDAKRTRCIPADLRHTNETEQCCPHPKLSHAADSDV